MPANDPAHIIAAHNLDCHTGDSVTIDIAGTRYITHTTGPARLLDDGRPAVDIALLKTPVDPRRLTIVEPRQLTLQL